MNLVHFGSAFVLVVGLACANGSVPPPGDDAADTASARVPGEAGDTGANERDAAPAGASEPAVQVPADATPVEFSLFQPASHANLGIRTRKRAVIRDWEEWRSWYHDLYSHMTPRPEPVGLDFDDQMVIAATMGQKYSAGHAIAIEEIRRGPDGTLYVTVVSGSPAEECVTSSVLTSPAVAVTLDAHPGEVVFVERELTLQC